MPTWLLVDGPLLRATDGGKLTHAPLQPGSVYDHVTKSVEQAYFISLKQAEPDLELDLCGHDPKKPKWGSHFMRRWADKRANDTMERAGTDPDTVNEAFGWEQGQRKKKQQLRYRGGTAIRKLARLNLFM